MLDDLKLIHERDVEDTLGIAERQPAQLTHELEISGDTSRLNDVHNVVYAAMGGSALASMFVKSWPKLSVPFEVVRDYDLPNYVGPNTLVIAGSYSGNTEETLAALAAAEDKGAKVAVVASGGKLLETAHAKNLPAIQIPTVAQPRYAVFYNFRALLDILKQVGLIGDISEELASTRAFLEEEVKAWLPTVPSNSNQAKRLALESLGKSVVVYSGPKLFGAAYKWKISFNENAKQVAWCGVYPEFNHNEFIGWSKQPVDKPYLVIDLRSSLEHERTQKRFEVTERLLSGMRPAPEVVNAKGDTILKQLLWTVALGDFASLYTGIANGLNPAPVELVERFKKALDE